MTLPVQDLRDLAACRAVVDLQIEVWGSNAEIVPASVLLVTVKRGGILLGAYDGATLVGFVWSIPGWRDGQSTQWSHMLGVAPAWRGRGLGETLKRAQRDRALARGVELIEWTFDPLQAVNAHLNLNQLGAVASVYHSNLYGDLDSPLMQGTPTDRLVAEWWISRPHVVRRLERRNVLQVRSADIMDAPSVIAHEPGERWPCVTEVRLDSDDPRVLIPIPARFGDMQREDRDVALKWRLGVRDVFTTYFARGYEAVDFIFNREIGSGAYILSRRADL